MMAPQIQELPAEGSREVVERELARASEARDVRGVQIPASAGDIARLLGDAVPIGAILDLNPSLAEVEQAALWHQGDGDMLGKTGHPLEGKAAAVFDLLQADDEDSER